MHGPLLRFFVKCLKFLPNLHTLEIRGGNVMGTSLKEALERVKLPQIKTLILPPTAHHILRHCHNVEDVVYVARNITWPSDEFLASLGPSRNSKIKRLTIPLIVWPSPSRE